MKKTLLIIFIVSLFIVIMYAINRASKRKEKELELQKIKTNAILERNSGNMAEGIMNLGSEVFSGIGGIFKKKKEEKAQEEGVEAMNEQITQSISYVSRDNDYVNSVA